LLHCYIVKLLKSSSWTRFRIVWRWFWLSSEWRLSMYAVILNSIQDRLKMILTFVRMTLTNQTFQAF